MRRHDEYYGPDGATDMEKFRDYWPLSVRTVYYRLLGNGSIWPLPAWSR